MAHGKCSVARVNGLEKQSAAWKLRLSGHNWHEIAEKVGYKNARVAKAMVDKYRLKIIQADTETVESERERMSSFIQEQIKELTKQVDFDDRSDYSLKVMAEIRHLTDQYIRINGLSKAAELPKQEGFSIPITLTLPEGINLSLPSPSISLPDPSNIIEGQFEEEA